MRKKFYTREEIDQYVYERIIVSCNDGRIIKGLLKGGHWVKNLPQYDAIIIDNECIPLDCINYIEISSK